MEGRCFGDGQRDSQDRVGTQVFLVRRAVQVNHSLVDRQLVQGIPAGQIVGDGGVDVYAYEELFDEIWAIQCKCYAAHHSVGPNVIRELYGSLHAYPEGTKGMVITTSSFTAGAIKEAERMGIKLVDGDEFSKEAQALGFH